jgi:energy-coupling factor transport system permease protein
MATAATKTTNPLLLALLIAVAAAVVAARRTDAPWALSFRLYLLTGLFVVLMRLLYRILLGGAAAVASGDGHVLFRLPALQLPDWTAGVQLLGPVTAENLLSGLCDGLRLATLIICVGAANTLANPKRLLKSVPGALYELGTAVVVAVSVFPQLAESAFRIRRARALRGGPTGGRGAIRAVLVPMLADALDRSLLLAASMDSRGYGRHGDTPRRVQRLTSAVLVIGLLGICVGMYGVLDTTTPRLLGIPILIGGLLVAAGGLRLAGSRVKRTRYRPDPWRPADLLVACCGVATAACFLAAVRLDPAAMAPSFSPLAWPGLPIVALVGVLIAWLPSWIAPPPPDGSS